MPTVLSGPHLGGAVFEVDTLPPERSDHYFVRHRKVVSKDPFIRAYLCHSSIPEEDSEALDLGNPALGPGPGITGPNICLALRMVISSLSISSLAASFILFLFFFFIAQFHFTK